MHIVMQFDRFRKCASTFFLSTNHSYQNTACNYNTEELSFPHLAALCDFVTLFPVGTLSSWPSFSLTLLWCDVLKSVCCCEVSEVSPERSRLSLDNEAYLIRAPIDSVRLSSTGSTICSQNKHRLSANLTCFTLNQDRN